MQFQKLPEEDKQILDNPLTISEIYEAIGHMNSGKTPGPDGLPVEFYKIFKNDQQGFIQKRQGYHNVRRVLNILFEKRNAKDTAMLAVDA